MDSGDRNGGACAVKVIFDIDGVLADFTLGVTGLGHSLFGLPVHSSGAQREWGFGGYGTEEQRTAIWKNLTASPDFWLKLPTLLTLGDLLAMAQLHRRGVEFVYLSSRPKTAAEQTEQWLRNIAVPRGRLKVVSGDKWLEVLLLQDGLLGVLEDDPRELLALRDCELPVFKMDWPYNRFILAPRVSSVAEFCDIVARSGNH